MVKTYSKNNRQTCKIVQIKPINFYEMPVGKQLFRATIKDVKREYKFNSKKIYKEKLYFKDVQIFIKNTWVRVVETLRDIHDRTDVPIVLVGMGTAERRLQRYKHLYDRISEIVKFEPFSKQDLHQIIDELSEVEITDCAKKLMQIHTNRFRQIVKIINKVEQLAKSNGLSSIDEITLKEVLRNDTDNDENIEK